MSCMKPWVGTRVSWNYACTRDKAASEHHHSQSLPYFHLSILDIRSRDRFPAVSLGFSVTYFLPTIPWPWSQLRPYWKWVPGTSGSKGGGCVRLTTSPPSRAECHEIWEPKPPGTLWATLGLLRDSFTFYHLGYYFNYTIITAWLSCSCFHSLVNTMTVNKAMTKSVM